MIQLQLFFARLTALVSKRAFLYFAIAALSASVQASARPVTSWEWYRLIATSLVQGFVAIKALDSLPGKEAAPVDERVKP